ncbi:Homeodomain-like DNA binding domain-containing transcription factor [Phycomyces blakesleeanus]|uniref:Homeodomain-like DNA binding domain-containing transcription factor n=2 Tax=Phycomyces blakesleeanus TaxID=4837 RepID=A0A167KVS4_PHYB8|nr:Homeodomain-like DNA binding domain-containing transcription factor [Phycomyces blakesleeanus NRRL 1555(-)]OAD69007.1 Homeodomain-like DNA binding domain-containing transcription factor [Phycomyces blakesleeanus NRRL 1555(-)]|eukprot:XP_018287047.1 Homeodomain-like DNA binding domain-containing transcription factor [Phycomyces blakesleeanus NRRL 1555(-)]
MSQEQEVTEKPKRKELSDYEKGIIVGMYMRIPKMSSIAKDLDIPYTTISSTIHRWKTTGTAQTKKRPGRPETLTERNKCAIQIALLRNPNISLQELTESIQKKVSARIGVNVVRKAIKEVKRRTLGALNEQPLDTELTTQSLLVGKNDR